MEKEAAFLFSSLLRDFIEVEFASLCLFDEILQFPDGDLKRPCQRTVANNAKDKSAFGVLDFVIALLKRFGNTGVGEEESAVPVGQEICIRDSGVEILGDLQL